MSDEANNDSIREEYQGSLTLPSETGPRRVTLSLDKERQAATVRFDTSIGGASRLDGSSVRVVRHPKYYEIQFMTTGLPQETVGLVWKLYVALEDDTLAGVVVARPNDLCISGEKGFTLVKRPLGD